MGFYDADPQAQILARHTNLLLQKQGVNDCRALDSRIPVPNFLFCLGNMKVAIENTSCVPRKVYLQNRQWAAEGEVGGLLGLYFSNP